MLIFRRIFNFEKAKVEQLEKRLNLRYAIGSTFPLQVTLRSNGRDYSAKVLDVSSNGIGVLVAPGTSLAAGHHLRADLVLGPHRLEINARIAHLQARENGIYLGLGLVFEEFELQKTYLQLLQPVVIGQSLKPMNPGLVTQDEPQFFKQIYIGEPDSLLTLRAEQKPGQPLQSFDFRMNEYFCRGIMQKGQAETYALESIDPDGAKLANPVFETSGGLHDEIRQLFRWVVPNLANTVPENVHEFLRKFAG
jgi:hypothetical protein